MMGLENKHGSESNALIACSSNVDTVLFPESQKLISLLRRAE